MTDSNKDNGLKLFVSKKGKGAEKSSSSSGSKSSADSSKQGFTFKSATAGLRQKDVKKRWMLIGIGVIGLVVFSSTMLSDKERTYGERTRVESMVSVTPPNADKAAFEAKYSQDLELFRAKLDKLSRDNEALSSSLRITQEKLDKQTKETERQLKDNKGKTPEGIVPPPTLGGSNTGGLGSLGPGVPPPPPFAPLTPPSIPNGVDNGSFMPPGPGSFQEPVGDPMVFDLGAEKKGNEFDSEDQEASVKYRKNPNAGMIPAGSFAPVVLLNGLDAGTSAATQSNPMPVLMTVTNQARLPGSARYQIKSCFVLGNGYGELSSERVYVRFNRISCVDKKDKLVLSQDVAGYLVDSDGKLGLRGVVSDRQGARLGKSVIAGFAQGLTGALGQSQSTITSNLSTGNTMSSISGGDALRASGLSGAQAATQQIAEFYLREAQSIFPVITIDNGRKGTIVFTNSSTLNWGVGDSKYVKEVSPL